MNEQLKRLSEFVKPLWERFPEGKRTTVIVTFLIVAGACAALLMWAFRPQYKVLYADLSLKDSGQITDILNEARVPYQLEDEGKRILVPANKVYAMRLKLAEAELPGEKGAGWELFDKTSLGVTDFVQKLNYRRGLEGELARTILTIDGVEAVRVHLVIPEESLFRETQKKTMASVTVRMRRGGQLASPQVEGVTYLVSSAVEGLTPDNVTVVDSHGYVLSKKTGPNDMMRLTSTQWEMQQQVESYLASKGQDLLDKRFGPGRSAIQVTAELDFKQLEQESETYDPENPSIRSEELTTSDATGTDTSHNKSEHSITNYELNLTKQKVVNPVGGIKRLTAAVMVDGSYTPSTDNKGEQQFVPLTSNELGNVSETIKSALGFSEVRGDQISVVSVPFQEVQMMETKQVTTADRWNLIFQYGQKVVTILAVVLLLLLVGSFIRKAGTEVARPSVPPQIAGTVEYPGALPSPIIDLSRQMSPEARGEAMLQEQLGKFVNDKPDSAAKLVRSWLIET